MKKLSTGDVLEVTGMTVRVLRKWCEHDGIRPSHRKEGTGQHYEFTVMQAVAVAFGLQWHKWGAGKQLVQPTVAKIAAMDEQWLKREFAAGRTHLDEIPGDTLYNPEPHDGFPPLGESWGRMTNLARIYNEVTAKIAELEKKPRPKRGGRVRGLAAN